MLSAVMTTVYLLFRTKKIRRMASRRPADWNIISFCSAERIYRRPWLCTWAIPAQRRSIRHTIDTTRHKIVGVDKKYKGRTHDTTTKED